MSERRDLIENRLRPIAAAIMNRIASATGGYNNASPYFFDEQNYENLEWKYTSTTGTDVRFYEPNQENLAYVEFNNIGVTSIESGELSAPILSEKAVSQVDLDLIDNFSDAPFEWEFNYSTTTSSTTREEFNAAVVASVQQSIWYGSSAYSPAGGVGGKTELELELAFAYERETENFTSSTKEHTLRTTVPPRTRMNIVQSRAVSSFTQQATTTGRLTFGVKCNQSGYSYFEFNSFDDMISAAQGFLPDTGQTETDDVIERWKANPLGEGDIDGASLDRLGAVRAIYEANALATVISEIKFERASTGDISVGSETIED